MERKLQGQKNPASDEAEQVQGQAFRRQTEISVVLFQPTLKKREEVADLRDIQYRQ